MIFKFLSKVDYLVISEVIRSFWHHLVIVSLLSNYDHVVLSCNLSVLWKWYFLLLANLSMGSPAYAAHSPLYISHPHHIDTRAAWLDEVEDVKPPRSLFGLPELSWPGVYLPCYERLATEENPWVLRMIGTPTPPAALPSRTPEPSPPKPSQTQDPRSEMEGQVEERCLEQVQTMVVGEVLKDIDTACKLLNIVSGRTESKHPPQKKTT